MTSSPGSTTTILSGVRRGGVLRLRGAERGAANLAMTGLVAVLLGLSGVLADQLGVSGRDADSLAMTAGARGAAELSGVLSGLDPDEARWRASRLDPRPACEAARASVTPHARVTTCSIVGTDLVVVVVTTDLLTSTASATVSLTEGPRT